MVQDDTKPYSIKQKNDELNCIIWFGILLCINDIISYFKRWYLTNSYNIASYKRYYIVNVVYNRMVYFLIDLLSKMLQNLVVVYETMMYDIIFRHWNLIDKRCGLKTAKVAVYKFNNLRLQLLFTRIHWNSWNMLTKNCAHAINHD